MVWKYYLNVFFFVQVYMYIYMYTVNVSCTLFCSPQFTHVKKKSIQFISHMHIAHWKKSYFSKFITSDGRWENNGVGNILANVDIYIHAGYSWWCVLQILNKKNYVRSTIVRRTFNKLNIWITLRHSTDTVLQLLSHQ